jgi:hypothetical protein
MSNYYISIIGVPEHVLFTNNGKSLVIQHLEFWMYHATDPTSRNHVTDKDAREIVMAKELVSNSQSRDVK